MYIFIFTLFIVLVLTFIFVNFSSFQIKEHVFWLVSLLMINLGLMIATIRFYYKKKYEPGARGFRGDKGDIGIDGEDFESCSNDNLHD